MLLYTPKFIGARVKRREDPALVQGAGRYVDDFVLPRTGYELDHTETPSPVNPLDAKGVGESGTIGATPAVVNAVLDALAPLGIRHIDMPLTPRRVWQAIQRARH